MTNIQTLKEALSCERVFRLEDLLFTPADAQKALDLFDKLQESSRKWFEAQTPMRMIFLGRADGMVLPKSGKQIKLENRERKLHS